MAFTAAATFAAETGADLLAAITGPVPGVAAAAPGCPNQPAVESAVPAPAPAALAFVRCGPCSDIRCVAGSGHFCPSGYTCQNVLGNICSGGTGGDCSCWKGPLP
jgi:hypothetical protein